MSLIARILFFPWRWLKSRRIKPSVWLKIYVLFGWDVRKSKAILAHEFNTSKADFLLADWQEKYVVARRDRIIGRAVYCSGEFELDKFEKAKRLYGQPTDHMTFVDIGANIGTMCIPMVARGHFSRAVAIEPEPLNVRLLWSNTHLNGVANQIEVFETAVGERTGSAALLLSSFNFGDHYVQADQALAHRRESVEVSVRKLDDLVPRGERADLFLWLDIQGYEGFVLKGAPEIIAGAPPMVLEFYPKALSHAQSYEALCDVVLGAPYTKLFDLNEEEPAAIPVTRQALAHLFDQYYEDDGSTDLLLLP